MSAKHVALAAAADPTRNSSGETCRPSRERSTAEAVRRKNAGASATRSARSRKMTAGSAHARHTRAMPTCPNRTSTAPSSGRQSRAGCCRVSTPTGIYLVPRESRRGERLAGELVRALVLRVTGVPPHPSRLH